MKSRSFYHLYGKRMLDLALSLAAVVLLAPLFIVLFALTFLLIGWPVFFLQARPGLGGRLFTIYKFRTMTDGVDEHGALKPDEERMTRFGTLCRTLSLDELPEILNVIRGDMSLVGPRPLMPKYLPRYNRRQARRHEVLPGITGWAQVNGRNALTWEEKFELDTWYVDNVSLRLDLAIMIRTLVHVVRRHGIAHDGYVTAPEFMGSPREEDVA